MHRYDTLVKLGISGGRTYLEATFPEGVPLETAFVGPSLLAQLEAAAEEALSAGSWIDVAPLLPPSLSAADISDLLTRCKCIALLAK